MINDTAAAIIAAQAKELEHLRAQRDQLQRDCTRFEAEARAARKEMRRVRAETVADAMALLIGKSVTVAEAGAGRIANVVAFSDGDCVCTVDFGDAGMKAFAGKSVRLMNKPELRADAPQEVDVIAWEFHFDGAPSWQLCNREGFLMARMTQKDSGVFEGTYESKGTVEPGCNIVWSRDPYTVAVVIKGRLKETCQLEGIIVDESLFERKRELRWEKDDNGDWVLKGQLDVLLARVERFEKGWCAWTLYRNAYLDTLNSAVEECESVLRRRDNRLDGLTVDRSLLRESEEPAAIPSQPKGEDIPKERLPFAWRRTGSRWSLDDVHGDRMGCVILYDGLRVHAEAGSSIVAEYDGDFRESDVLDYVDRVESALVASGEAKPGDFDRSALELESPLVYAAKWERSGHRWVLINGMLIVARLEQNGTNEEFEAVVDGVIVDRHTKMKAAATAEWHARHSGLIPTGHIDRSALT